RDAARMQACPALCQMSGGGRPSSQLHKLCIFLKYITSEIVLCDTSR
ncbi:hypothetical protein CSUI_009229, partial [Cystoisospora suis]